MTQKEAPTKTTVSRRTVLRRALVAGAGLGAASTGGAGPFGLIRSAWADGQAADRHLAGRLAGRFGVHRHLACRAPAPTRVQGEDELKGYQLAVEHINAGPSADQEDLAEDHEGRARQGGEVRRRRLRRQAERRGAGAAALHHREQGGHDHRRHLERRRGGAQQARAAREGAVRVRHLRLERHHRQGLRALRRAPECFYGADRGERRSARCCSRPSARTRRPRI